MAKKFEKPARDFFSRFQKDVDNLQATILKMSGEVEQRLRKATTDEKVQAKKQNVETFIQGKLDKVAPAVSKFLGDLSVNAKKAGIDLSSMENGMQDLLSKTQSHLRTKAGTAKHTTSRKKQPVKKKTVKTSSIKKTTGKKTTGNKNTAKKNTAKKASGTNTAKKSKATKSSSKKAPT